MTTPASKAQFSEESSAVELVLQLPEGMVASGQSLSESSEAPSLDAKSTEAKGPKPTDPLTLEEVKAAADRFFPLFDIILDNMPEDSTIEDSLKVMESVCGLAHKMRLEQKEKDKEGVFGFNKKAPAEAEANE